LGVLSAEFEFEIGDEVMHANASLGSDSLLGVTPAKLIVVERVIQQCHGGIQKFCKVRGVQADGNFSGLVDICTFELRPYPTQCELDKISDAAEEARDARSAARRMRRQAQAAETVAANAEARCEEVKRPSRD